MEQIILLGHYSIILSFTTKKHRHNSFGKTNYVTKQSLDLLAIGVRIPHGHHGKTRSKLCKLQHFHLGCKSGMKKLPASSYNH